MSTHVAINGFGRVGRAAFRSAYERGDDIDWVAINDLADAETLAALLRHDSVYNRFPGSIEADEEVHGAALLGQVVEALSQEGVAGRRLGEL